jgi:hypothetical protein
LRWLDFQATVPLLPGRRRQVFYPHPRQGSGIVCCKQGSECSLGILTARSPTGSDDEGSAVCIGSRWKLPPPRPLGCRRGVPGAILRSRNTTVRRQPGHSNAPTPHFPPRNCFTLFHFAAAENEAKNSRNACCAGLWARFRRAEFAQGRDSQRRGKFRDADLMPVYGRIDARTICRPQDAPPTGSYRLRRCSAMSHRGSRPGRSRCS